MLGEDVDPNAGYASRAFVASLGAGHRAGDSDGTDCAPSSDALPPRPQLEPLIDGFALMLTGDSCLVQRRACVFGLGALVLGLVENPHDKRPQLAQLDLDLAP